MGDDQSTKRSIAIRFIAHPNSTLCTALTYWFQVCTTADEGKSLGGCFHITYSNMSTECIPHDAPAHTLQALMEAGLNAEPVANPGPLPYSRSVEQQETGTTSDTGSGLSNEASSGRVTGDWVPGIGRVNVTTDGFVDDQGGRCWNVTFASAVGAVGPLSTTSSSSLSGIGASVSVEMLQAGNSMSGNFSLKLFGGESTGDIAFDASADELSAALMSVPGVASVHTIRTNPATSCADGLCRERDGETFAGRTPGGGLEWTVELATRIGNTEPSSPTIGVGSATDGAGVVVAEEEGIVDWPQANRDNLQGEGAAMEVRHGWLGSSDQLSARFNASRPFSIALGGAGASHGEAFVTAIVGCRILRRWRYICSRAFTDFYPGEISIQARSRMSPVPSRGK